MARWKRYQWICITLDIFLTYVVFLLQEWCQKMRIFRLHACKVNPVLNLNRYILYSNTITYNFVVHFDNLCFFNRFIRKMLSTYCNASWYWLRWFGMDRTRSSVGVLQDGGCIQPGLLLQSKNSSAQHIRRGKWYIAAKNYSCLSKNVPGNYNAANYIVPLYYHHYHFSCILPKHTYFCSNMKFLLGQDGI